MSRSKGRGGEKGQEGREPWEDGALGRIFSTNPQEAGSCPSSSLCCPEHGSQAGLRLRPLLGLPS